MTSDELDPFLTIDLMGGRESKPRLIRVIRAIRGGLFDRAVEEKLCWGRETRPICQLFRLLVRRKISLDAFDQPLKTSPP